MDYKEAMKSTEWAIQRDLAIEQMAKTWPKDWPVTLHIIEGCPLSTVIIRDGHGELPRSRMGPNGPVDLHRHTTYGEVLKEFPKKARRWAEEMAEQRVGPAI